MLETNNDDDDDSHLNSIEQQYTNQENRRLHFENKYGPSNATNVLGEERSNLSLSSYSCLQAPSCHGIKIFFFVLVPVVGPVVGGFAGALGTTVVGKRREYAYIRRRKRQHAAHSKEDESTGVKDPLHRRHENERPSFVRTSCGTAFRRKHGRLSRALNTARSWFETRRSRKSRAQQRIADSSSHASSFSANGGYPY